MANPDHPAEFKLTIEGDRSGESFDFSLDSGPWIVPATFWNGPSRSSRDPLTLLQHGGVLHKRHPLSDALARSVAGRTQGAVLLIDGPIHGRRRSDEPDVMEMLGQFKRLWREDPRIDAMVGDWGAALDAVLDRGWADPDRVAWLGLSMGTAYGIPLCAAERRITAAALGMWGAGWGQEHRLLEDARAVTVPVLFQVKTEDELFSGESQREIFDAIGSRDKHLHAFAGGHSMSAPGQVDDLVGFLADHLRPRAPGSGRPADARPASSQPGEALS